MEQGNRSVLSVRKAKFNMNTIDNSDNDSVHSGRDMEMKSVTNLKRTISHDPDNLGSSVENSTEVSNDRKKGPSSIKPIKDGKNKKTNIENADAENTGVWHEQKRKRRGQKYNDDPLETMPNIRYNDRDGLVINEPPDERRGKQESSLCSILFCCFGKGR